MKRISIAIMATVNLLYAGSLFSQVVPVEYSPDFKFVEGIYVSYEEFKNNDPSIRQKAIITERDNWSNQSFWGNLRNQQDIAYYGPDGDIRELDWKVVWGYSTGRNIYIRSGRYFNRIFTIGSIMHFMEQYSMPSFNQVPPASLNQNNMMVPNLGSKSTVRGSPHLIDYDTGEVLTYSFASLTRLLEKDPELYEEFTSIKRQKKKKEQMFFYLRKFNERHPVYFPVRQ